MGLWTNVEFQKVKTGQLLTSVEICSGAGGQALGLEQAGFEHIALVENDKHACETLRVNRNNWNVMEMDVREFSATPFRGVDLLAGGVPCPPFSVAGKQLGHEDERDLFPEALRLLEECAAKALMIENVKGLLEKRFDSYREKVTSRLRFQGYQCFWKLLNASDFGVPQLRPRVILVALKNEIAEHFEFPNPHEHSPKTVGETLVDLMEENGWEHARSWMHHANQIAPTLVGGSKKHGGPDLGPTRAKRAWSELGVNGHGLANEAPQTGFIGLPKLTPRMTARLQGFPDEWKFSGKKTNSYRQIGNAFPPPVAKAVAMQIRKALEASNRSCSNIAA
jgi:DNA (cytosine-5)-methyltransferase 1